QILLPDEVEIVERRHAYRSAADLHRVELGEGVQRARASDVDADPQQLRLGDIRRELARDRPARLAPADRAQLLLEGQRIHFHDAPVDAEVERGPHVVLDDPGPALYGIERRAQLPARGDGAT